MPVQRLYAICVSITFDVYSGLVSQVVKVSYLGCPCHEFKLSATKDPPCRAAMHVKSDESSNFVSLVWCGSWERGWLLRCRSRHSTMVQNYVIRRQKPSCS
ncbi:uncharacterized protein TNCV_2473701 [Trichonephila clavipes]|nr:uncharacterized protein TNCV_2473701 [Trichonephila clavipes]